MIETTGYAKNDNDPLHDLSIQAMKLMREYGYSAHISCIDDEDGLNLEKDNYYKLEPGDCYKIVITLDLITAEERANL